MNKNVLLEIKNNIAIITINRPEKRNALNKETIVSLCNAITRITLDKEIFVAIITGDGSAFCSGLDLNVIKEKAFLRYLKSKESYLPGLIANCNKPIIGAINGAAITGSFEIALNCDFLIASSEAFFVDTHIRADIHPGWGITLLPQQAIGQRKAKKFLFRVSQYQHN